MKIKLLFVAVLSTCGLFGNALGNEYIAELGKSSFNQYLRRANYIPSDIKQTVGITTHGSKNERQIHALTAEIDIQIQALKRLQIHIPKEEGLGIVDNQTMALQQTLQNQFTELARLWIQHDVWVQKITTKPLVDSKNGHHLENHQDLEASYAKASQFNENHAPSSHATSNIEINKHDLVVGYTSYHKRRAELELEQRRQLSSRITNYLNSHAAQYVILVKDFKQIIKKNPDFHGKHAIANQLIALEIALLESISRLSNESWHATFMAANYYKRWKTTLIA